MFPVRSATELQSFSLNEVDEETVLKHLLSLKTNKAIGLDNISTRLLKCGARAICPSITKLLNLSIRTSNFPEIIGNARKWPHFSNLEIGQMRQIIAQFLFCQRWVKC